MKVCCSIVAVTIITLSLVCGCSRSRDKSGVRNIVTSENTEADLGTVKEEDGLVQVNLIVRNVTGDTIRPLRAYAHCRCVEADLDRTPVAPGENLVVPVTYNPAYRSGRFMEEVQVYYNDSHHLLSLIIKGDVIPMKHPVEEDYPYDFGEGVHMSHETLHFGMKATGETGEIFIRIANESKKPADVIFEPEARYAGIISGRNIRLDAKGRDTLHFHFRMPDGLAPGDTLLFGIQPAVNGRHLSKLLNIKAIGK